MKENASFMHRDRTYIAKPWRNQVASGLGNARSNATA